MLSNNCDDEMLVIPPTNNEWTQTTMIDDHQHHNHKGSSSSSSMMGPSTGGGRGVMEKAGSGGQEVVVIQQQEQALKCPRCDSSNTKFCYYNNYSLSQPRHFCKACKRYWTRGGTLRNVPVGGGCRKNSKRLKRHSSSSSSTTTTATASPPSSSTPNSNNNNITAASTSNHINPTTLFYGLPTASSRNSCEAAMNNLPFPGFSSSGTRSGGVSSSNNNNSGYDLQLHHLNAALGGGLGLFSSGIMSSEASDTTDNGGFGTSCNSSFLSAYNSIFGGSSNNSTATTPVMASLLSSTLLQQKLINNGGSNNSTSFQQGLAPLEESALVMASKEVRGEGGQWNHQIDHHHHHHHHVTMSDPSLYWNTASATAAALGGAWTENQTNIGPSVTSLI